MIVDTGRPLPSVRAALLSAYTEISRAHIGPPASIETTPLCASTCLTYSPVASLMLMSPAVVERAVIDSTRVFSWIALLARTLRSSAMNTEAPSAEISVASILIAPVAPTMPPSSDSLPAMLSSMLRALP